MKVRHSNTPLPRYFHTLPGADKAAEIYEIRVSGYSRLWIKVLLFRTNRDLCRFFNRNLYSGLDRDTRGVVSYLGTEVISFKDGKESTWEEVDPRYFAVMGLLTTHLTPEILCHESVHAAFAYARRAGSRNRWPGATGQPDENVCYPAGRIMRFLTEQLKKDGYIP